MAPFDGAGNFALPPGSIVADGSTIDAADHNTPVTDIAAALSQVLLRSGVAPMTGNLDMGGFAITNQGGAYPTLGGSNAWTGTNTWTGSSTMTTATSNGIPLELVSTNDDTVQGPQLSLYRNSISPVDADVIGAVSFYGKDSTAAKTLYGSIVASALDITNASEDGALYFSTLVTGASGNRMAVGAGVFHPGVTGGDKGVGSINFDSIYLDGTILGTAATRNTGTSGATVPLLNGGNTWSQTQRIEMAVGSNWIFSTKATDKVAPAATWISTYFFDGSNQVAGSITHFSNGAALPGSTQYNTNSDARLKSDRRPIADSGAIIDALNPIYFRWAEQDNEDFGFVAQEIAAIPQVGHTIIKGDDDDPSTPRAPGEFFKPYQMQHGRLEAILVAELQALRARVAELEAKVDSLTQ